MANKPLHISIALIFLLSSCVKTVTKTCTCKDAHGTVMTTETHNGDKKSAQSFEESCRRKAVKSSSTSNGVTTSTTVPCEIS